MTRPYQLGQRQVAADKTRAKILAAARALIAKGHAHEFSIDGVARRAKVARTTVYHQFGTRAALLEAVFDTLAERGEIATRLAQAFTQPVARDVLADVVAAFAFFWNSDRLVLRRLQAMATLDTELGDGLRARNRRRHQTMLAVVRRLQHERGDAMSRTADEVMRAVDVCYGLTSFSVFDTMAGDGEIEAVLPMIQQMVWHTVTEALRGA